MALQDILSEKIKAAVQSLYGASLERVEFQATRKEFEGDITVVVFPMLKVVKGNPVQIGESIGNYLVEHVEEVSRFNVVKGFLNLVLSDAFFLNFFTSVSDFSNYGKVAQGEDAMMVEYASPNTNKPLHLGHIRNVLLGYSVAEILKAAGKKVYKTQIINDRGIHICKSMLAWKTFGNGETPESTGLKGDHLVGKYYVKFEQVFQEEYSQWLSTSKEALQKCEEFGQKPETQKLLKEKYEEKVLNNEDLSSELFSEFRKHFKNEYFTELSEIGGQAQEMLRKWEAGDEETVALWKMMNGWVYDGFEVTYKDIGVDFDSYYYESNTYLLGKDNIMEGLESGVFFKKEDGSVWCDLSDEGLDEKLVLRSDGTAVYMTQDIGTAIQRVKDKPDINGMIYTVGNEQDYHFKVLFLILKKLGNQWAENLHHLSYGMVDLPTGKMKSREGTVVDADDLIVEMANTARDISEDLGKIDDFSEEEKDQLYQTIGLGALKYYILKVDPKKRILFDPEESVDFQGNTGPFIQYTYARIQAILRQSEGLAEVSDFAGMELHAKEKEVLKQIQMFPETLQLAASQYSPAIIANYTYDLVKNFNSFYQNVSILGADTEQQKSFRVQLSKATGKVIQSAFALLGIQVPERM
ncbi:arginine--tRNA ligase [Aureisphaera galaxeae]|uniref:arginine--tRNA ligase n=1 Tax=Aureisphaera galaxeae TaxID=1538023 RepID=UPI0023505F30|nr:arginine--tRNA ligase [Aureisphaera galaxeae]MDC8005526.1 arginine--tRNA ligase [Aureisphaera galaxeae]